MWWPHKVRIKIGEPLDFSRYFGMANDRFIQRSMTDEIMYALMELSGNEYVDVYAAKAKEDAARGEEAGPGDKELPARLPRTRAS
jgi:1-acyl-sn-glycerol-3-phosphate acyltransferase